MHIRLAKPDDAEQLAAIYRPAVTDRVIEPPAPRPLPEVLSEVEALLAARHTGH